MKQVKKPMTASEMALHMHKLKRKEMGEKKYKAWIWARFQGRAKQDQKIGKKTSKRLINTP